MFKNLFLTVGAVVALAGACRSAEASTSVIVGDAAPMMVNERGSLGYTSEGGVLTLNAPLTGPQFCGNPLLSGQSPTYSLIRFAPSHANWILPTALDVASVGYGGGGEVVRINAPPVSSSLVCYGASSIGWPLTPFRDGLFYHAFEDAVPANPYPADIGAASVTGVTDTLVDGPRMLTQVDPNGNIYMYMFRLRASAPGGADVRVLVRDGYYAAVLGDTAWHCQLNALPVGPIDLRSVCANDPNTLVSIGPIKREYLLNDSSTDRYIIVHRYMIGTPSGGLPVAGAAVFVRPGPVMDRFTGDNLVFSVPPGISP